MRSLRTTKQFERDLRRAKRRRKNLEKLWTVVEILRRRGQLAPRYRPHRLSGEWQAFWECHIEGDWLLIWHEREDALVLVRTGTHTDLFG
ncbi:MAG: type II toxin-antitoxin system YafQ family toxin [Kiloniellales bacterium]